MSPFYITMPLTNVLTIMPHQNGLVRNVDELALERIEFKGFDPIDFVFQIERKVIGSADVHEFSIAEYLDAVRYENGVAYVDPNKFGIHPEFLTPSASVWISFAIHSRNTERTGNYQPILYGKLKLEERRPAFA